MIVGLIILYILFGILVFVILNIVENNAEYDDPEWYESFYKKSRFYRISVRLCQIIFWPFIIIAIFLYLLHIGTKYIYKNLIK